MSDIRVEYAGLDSGSNTAKTAGTKTTEIQVDLSDAKTKLNDSTILMGPVQEDCAEEINELDTNLNAIIKDFENIASVLSQAKETYQKGDKAAAETLIQSVIHVGVKATDYKNPANISGAHLDFINSIKDGAVQSYNEYGVLPSLTMAQAILESGWGGSSIGNNIFGIKAGSGWTGKRQNCKTSEQNADGSYVQIYADFRDYDSIDDSIKDHAELLTQDRYKPVIDAKDYKEACYAVKNCGYATSHEYANNLISIIEQYGLNQWDPVNV